MARPLVIDAGTVQQLGASTPLTLTSVLALPSGSGGDLVYYPIGGGLHVHNGSTWVTIGGGGAYYDARRAAAHGA